MSDSVILAVVAMVCVSVALPVILGMFLGRRVDGKASSDGFELSTGPDAAEPK